MILQKVLTIPSYLPEATDLITHAGIFAVVHSLNHGTQFEFQYLGASLHSLIMIFL